MAEAAIGSPATPVRRAALLPALALAFGLLASAAAAQPASDPDWPCVQRLVPVISGGQVWSASPLDELGDGWQQDPEIAPLVQELTSRRTPLPRAEAAARAFAAALPEEQRGQRVALLFKGVLDTINAQRGELIEGIKRFARRQQQLAGKIAATNARLDTSVPGRAPSDGESLRSERDWDLRVYDERQRSLGVLCEQPVLLDQRAFALARVLQAEPTP